MPENAVSKTILYLGLSRRLNAVQGRFLSQVRLITGIVSMVTLCCGGCDVSFNPKAPFEKKLVVLSVLSNDREMQFVRVSTNYDVSGFDASENRTDKAVLGARVRITDSSNTFIFRDTLLPRSDADRYSTPIVAYVASPFRVDRGRTYRLSVTSEDIEEVSAIVSVPDAPIISFAPGPLILDHPDQFEKKSTMALVARLSPLSKGYQCQIFVDYKVLLESGWKDERVEIPTVILVDTLDLFVARYPQFRRAEIAIVQSTFYNDAYINSLVRVLLHYPRTPVTFKRVVLRVLQCEQSFYDYFNTVNGFRDQVSIRIDEPDYTNIKGGIGLFGAYTLDSLSHDLPQDFGLNVR